MPDELDKNSSENKKRKIGIRMNTKSIFNVNEVKELFLSLKPAQRLESK